MIFGDEFTLKAEPPQRANGLRICFMCNSGHPRGPEVAEDDPRHLSRSPDRQWRFRRRRQVQGAAVPSQR